MTVAEEDVRWFTWLRGCHPSSPVNYIKGSSHRLNDILLFFNRVNANLLCVYVGVLSERKIEDWTCQSNLCVMEAIGGLWGAARNSGPPKNSLKGLKTVFSFFFFFYNPWHVNGPLSGSWCLESILLYFPNLVSPGGSSIFFRWSDDRSTTTRYFSFLALKA